MNSIEKKLSLMGVASFLLMVGCTQQKVQDPLFIKGSTALTLMPAQSSHSAYRKSSDKLTSTPVAYEEPRTLAFADRTLFENLSASLEVADYLHVLTQVGLTGYLKAEGPYTVFAIPNRSLERYVDRFGGGLMSAQNRSTLQRLLAFTIVPGTWDSTALDAAMRRQKTDRIGLKTLSGDQLIVVRDRRTGVFHLENHSGRTVELWLSGARQSNGMLYFTNDVLSPG